MSSLDARKDAAKELIKHSLEELEGKIINYPDSAVYYDMLLLLESVLYNAGFDKENQTPLIHAIAFIEKLEVDEVARIFDNRRLQVFADSVERYKLIKSIADIETSENEAEFETAMDLLNPVLADDIQDALESSVLDV